jgi:hypothetical protein
MVQTKLSLRLTKHHDMKTHGGVELQLRTFLTLELDDVERAALLPRKLGGSQSRSERGGKEKNSQDLLRIEPPSSSP